MDNLQGYYEFYEFTHNALALLLKKRGCAQKKYFSMARAITNCITLTWVFLKDFGMHSLNMFLGSRW